MPRRLALLLLCAGLCRADLQFAILGDRTGNADQAVYEAVWKEIERAKMAFAINVGDTIEGLHDESALRQWHDLRPLWTIPFYFTPGNHDIWSAASAKIYAQQTKHPPQYSFTFAGQVHITVLELISSESLSAGQLAFLEMDLQAVPAGVPRLIFFHVPFWILPLSFGSGDFALHRLAKQYKVAAVVSGHGHQFVKFTRDGVQYLEAGSSGASIARGTSSGLGAAEGWFYGWTLCRVQGMHVDLEWRKVGEKLP